MSDKQSNPADKLHAIFDRAKRYKIETHPVSAMWRDTFSLPETGQDLRYYKYLIALNELLIEFERAIGLNDDIKKKNLHLKYTDKIKECVDIRNQGRHVSSFKKLIDSAVMDGLSHSSEMLSQQPQEETIEEDELEGLINSIKDLDKEIEDYEISIEFKAYLRSILAHLNEAIIHYKYYGTFAAVNEIGMALGKVLIPASSPASDEEATWYKKVMDTANNILTVFSKIKNAKEVLEPIYNKLVPAADKVEAAKDVIDKL